jgi:hypothetical protein
MLFHRLRSPYAVGMDWTLGTIFHFASTRRQETLVPGLPLRLTHARGRQVTCERGCVWITAPGEPDDIFLHPGQTWMIPANGLVLVEAEASAVVTLGC